MYRSQLLAFIIVGRRAWRGSHDASPAADRDGCSSFSRIWPHWFVLVRVRLVSEQPKVQLEHVCSMTSTHRYHTESAMTDERVAARGSSMIGCCCS